MIEVVIQQVLIPAARSGDSLSNTEVFDTSNRIFHSIFAELFLVLLENVKRGGILTLCFFLESGILH